MSNQFCRHCGQTLESGVLFCTHCGYSVDEPAHSDEMRADAQLSAQPTQTMPSEKRKLRISIMPFLLGIILVIAGVAIVISLANGPGATAQITSVKQRVDATSEKIEKNYDIYYSFQTADGRLVEGSYSVKHVYDVMMLPKVGSEMGVRYVPWLPSVNKPMHQSPVSTAPLLIAGFGLLLIALSIHTESKSKNYR